MSNPPLRLSGVLLSLLLAGCGANDGGPSFPATADSVALDDGAWQGRYTIVQAVQQLDVQASNAVSTPLTSPAAVDLLFATLDRIGGGALAAAPQFPIAAAPFSQCEPVITGVNGSYEPLDSDGDGIPDDYKVDYGAGCVFEDSAGSFRLTISGYRRLQDTGHGFRSFRATLGDLRFVAESLQVGRKDVTQYHLVDEGTFAATAGSYGVTGSVTRALSRAGLPTLHWFWALDEHADFVPGVGLALALGSPLPYGTVTYRGDLQIIEPDDPESAVGRNYHLTLDTPTPLQYEPTCYGGDFVAGSFRGLFNGDPDVGFQYTWSTCADPTRELFGATP